VGVTLRQAAIIVALAYLLDPVSYAEFSLYPKLVVAGNAAQTIHNIDAHGGMFAAAVLCYLINFLEDIVIAWGLFVLLVPVNRALSLLTAWLRLIYTAMGLAAVMQLATAYRLIAQAHGSAALDSAALQTQVQMLISSFRFGWSFSLIVFGFHLILLGYLVYRSRYMPKILGTVLSLVGVSWIVYELRPYLYPAASLGWIPLVGIGELLLPLWLLFMGWRIKAPDDNASLGVRPAVDVG
jgi:hypothetical protein